MKNIIVSSVLAISLVGVLPGVGLAQTTSSTAGLSVTITNLLSQIQALQSQINNLQTQKQAALTQLVSTLRQGSTGDQVSMLQALLAADSSIYPEGLITGFFGSATARAVRKFQKDHGLEQVGVVGPKTLKALNELLKDNPIKFESENENGDNENDHKNNNNSNEGNENHGNRASSTLSKLAHLCAIVPPGH